MNIVLYFSRSGPHQHQEQRDCSVEISHTTSTPLYTSGSNSTAVVPYLRVGPRALRRLPPVVPSYLQISNPHLLLYGSVVHTTAPRTQNKHVRPTAPTAAWAAPSIIVLSILSEGRTAGPLNCPVWPSIRYSGVGPRSAPSLSKHMFLPQRSPHNTEQPGR